MAAPDPRAVQPILAAVRVNGQDAGDPWPLVRSGGVYHATAQAFAAWRLRVPESAPVQLEGLAMYPLRPPLDTRFDSATQTLFIQAPAAAFVTSTLEGADTGRAVPTPPSPGAFLNYDLRWARDHDADQFGAAIEAGVFGKAGVLTTTAVARDLTGRRELTRLQTTFSRDDPATMTTLRIGDTIGAASPWGRRPYFGGVQWATNFSTRPDLVLLPLPSLRGEALLPSVADVYVNNVLSTRREVPPGPFTLNQVPVLTGAGEVRLVVRDALGRDQVVNLSYYLSPELLRRGLHEFSWEAGAQRENLGISSSDYGPWFAATTHRYGINDRLTADGRIEAGKGMGALGVGAVYLVRELGTIAGGVAGSLSQGRGGGRAYAQLQRVTRAWSLSARVEGASRGFRQLGMAEGELPPVMAAQVFGSLSLPARQTLSAGYVRARYRVDGRDVELLSLGYSVQIGSRLSATLSAFRSFVDEGDWGGSVTLSYALDDRRFLSAGVTAGDGFTQGSLQFQQGLPTDTGFGYDMRAGVGDTGSFGGRLLYQNRYGNYGIEASRFDNRSGFAADAAGGIVTMGGHTLLARRVQDSFAMVEVPGLAGVDIYSNNQRVGRTNAAGVGLIPNLLPYQRNVVRVDERGLPVETELDFSERTVAPYARSGALVTFVARVNNGATLRIVTEDHEWMPLGSEVRAGDAGVVHHVARRGEVFLPEIAYPLRVQVARQGHSCTFIVPIPATREPLPRLGPFKCRTTPP